MRINLTKKDIINSIYMQIGFSKKVSENLFDLLQCDNYSRADFRMDNQNNFWFLEMNTLPGMTETSLVPMSALAGGISFNDLINKIVMQSWHK